MRMYCTTVRLISHPNRFQSFLRFLNLFLWLGLRGRQFESNDFSRTGDESDEELDQTHRTYTRSPLGSEL